MKTKKTISAIAIVAAITAVTAITASVVSITANENSFQTAPICEISAYELAEFMDNPYPNSFSNFRIVTNAHMEDLNTVVVGEDAFLFAGWGYYSETPEVTVLFNTKGTTDATDDEIIQVYEPPIDEVSELNLYESIYNDMWSLR